MKNNHIKNSLGPRVTPSNHIENNLDPRNDYQADNNHVKNNLDSRCPHRRSRSLLKEPGSRGDKQGQVRGRIRPLPPTEATGAGREGGSKRRSTPFTLSQLTLKLLFMTHKTRFRQPGSAFSACNSRRGRGSVAVLWRLLLPPSANERAVCK